MIYNHANFFSLSRELIKQHPALPLNFYFHDPAHRRLEGRLASPTTPSIEPSSMPPSEFVSRHATFYSFTLSSLNNAIINCRHSEPEGPEMARRGPCEYRRTPARHIHEPRPHVS